MTTGYTPKWWMTNDRETYHNECDTEQEAIRVALNEGYMEIALCTKQDFDLSLDFDDIYSALYGRNDTRIGDGDFIDPTKEQALLLEKTLTEAIYKWAHDCKINLVSWSFAKIEQITKVGPILEAEVAGYHGA